MKKTAYFISVVLLCLVALCFSASAAHEHSYKTTEITKATLTENGKTVEKCSCGEVKKNSTKKVYKVKSVKLSASSYTYNGKEQTPTVTVKDSKGNILRKGTDYTVKYENGRKLPGRYNVRITLKSKYSGVQRVSFTIAPKTTSKVTVSQTEGTITLKWKKVTGADGYAVFQYTAEGWKRIKTIKSPDTLSYTVKMLRPGTDYKFRIKAYTKDSGTIWGKATATVNTSTKATPPWEIDCGALSDYIMIDWFTVQGADGFAVFMSTSGGWKKVQTIKATTNQLNCTIENLKPNTNYKLRLQPYIINNGTIWGTPYDFQIKTKPYSDDEFQIVNGKVFHPFDGKSAVIIESGLTVYPITSKEAKKIYDKWGSPCYIYYEGRSADNKVIIWTMDSTGWGGIDLSGATYDEYGVLEICPYCGKIKGVGTNMCNGCNIYFV